MRAAAASGAHSSAASVVGEVLLGEPQAGQDSFSKTPGIVGNPRFFSRALTGWIFLSRLKCFEECNVV